ncbi:hypothetical protein PSACC_03151 [Paramicrosporidium saccamoebae]|uniref:NAD(P)-binding domain-containing protein n=1 Tax=Paramicrosporidium saccamoebae TaxID=1246581 RepID=A0A2H9TH02_9FUNG|nr:hypothetical protein PSACC_03151 [Paramicrosporidium saccamoebae]
MKLLVLGGTGFVGRAVCREAVRRGWNVTSLSRRGVPESMDGLLEKVEWRTGSALDRKVYPELMSDRDYVVHCIGTLFESNPVYNLYKKQPINYESSYKALIRDTLELAVESAASAKVKAFGYVSAARYGAIGKTVLPGYMEMKGQAEELLLKRNEFRKVIMRPGFMYGSDRWATIPMSLGVTFTSLFTAGMMPKALCVDTVARALLTELNDSETESSTMEVSDIARIGSL